MSFIGKVFSSIATGSRVVQVCCDRCGTEYYYNLTRQAIGTGSAPFYLGQKMAARSAEKNAGQQLARRLQRESELVPCPNCHWINRSLVEGYRRTRHLWATKTAMVLGMAIFLSVLMFNAMDGRRIKREPEWPACFARAGASAAVVAAIPLALRWRLRRLINPNRRFPRPPVVPEGTPSAWTRADAERPEPRDPDRFAPVDPASTAWPDWAVFPAGTLVLPQACCECLAPATAKFKVPLRISDADQELDAPLCAQCASRLRSSWWLALLLTGAGGAVLSFLFYHYLFREAPLAQALTAMAVFLIFTIVCMAMVAGRVVRPYRLRFVDRGRGIFRIRFRNEQYTELVRRECRRMKWT